MSLAVFMLFYDNGTIPNYFEKEAKYTKEWINHHIHVVNADAVVIYSQHPIKLEKSVSPSPPQVIFRVWTPVPRKMEAMNDALSVFSHYDWIAFLDNDEFIYSTCGGDLKSDLMEWKDRFDVIKIPWATFGTCGHEKRPRGSLMDCYRTYREDSHVKLIVQPKKVKSLLTPHLADIDPSKCLKVKHRKYQINHYRTKSVEEAYEKCMVRGFDRHDWPKTEKFAKQYINEANAGPHKEL